MNVSIDPELGSAMRWRAREFSFWRTWKLTRQISPYYRALPELQEPCTFLDQLAALPIVTRATVAAEEAAFRRLDALPAAFLTTSGTSGSPLRIGILPEARAHIDFLLALDGAREVAETRPLTMHVVGSSNGTATTAYREIGTLGVPLRSRAGYSLAWQLLTAEHSFEGYSPRVRHIVMPLPAIKKLVHYILEEGLDPRALAVDQVVSYSAYLSRSWRKRIEQVLGAPVQNVFGFTEIPAFSALECAGCGAFHASPDTIVEVLDGSGRTVGQGATGHLTVTTLRPELTDLPLLRYAPGDLVTLHDDCPLAGEPGFVPKGRECSAVGTALGARTQWLLFPFDVQDLLDDQPWIARSNHPRHMGVTRTEDESYPKWRAGLTTGETLRLEVELEVRFSPSLFPDAWHAIRAPLRERLLIGNASLRDAVRSGLEFRIEAVTEGTLAPDSIVRC